MKINHLASLKQWQKPPSWTYLASYWLAKDIYNFLPIFHYLKNDNRIKAMNPKTPFYYHDLIYYIKVENKTILTEKPKTKKIYLNMLKHVGRDHIITGEKLWKNKIQNLNFAEIWKNTFFFVLATT